MFVVIALALAVGWTAHSVYLDSYTPQENNLLIPGQSSIFAKVNGLFSSAEIMSPEDHITENQIKVYNNEVVLDIDNAVWSSFTDTNSMDPLLDINANGIEIVPQSEDDIHIGDIISYDSGTGIVIHRVIGILSDEDGLYYVMKGDNNPIPDKQKVRFSDVEGILVAVVY
jgi:hypothetical protein